MASRGAAMMQRLGRDEAGKVCSTYLHCNSCFLAQLDQLLIAFLNFLVQALVLNLQLLKVDQVQPLCIETSNPLVAVMQCAAFQTQGMLTSTPVPAAAQNKWCCETGSPHKYVQSRPCWGRACMQLLYDATGSAILSSVYPYRL